MKTYPSIQASTGQKFTEMPNAYIFDKYDGSNLRWEWNKKQGWYKFGTRSRLFDGTDPIFGGAIDIFNNLSEPLTKYAHDSKADSVIVYTEFWGDNSFAGKHHPLDTKRLTLFDVSIHKRGFVSPKEFIKRFGHLDFAAKCLGQYNWTRGFVKAVKEGSISGITFEGVVGKAGEGHDLQMAKAKTQAWLDRVIMVYGAEEGQRIINS